MTKFSITMSDDLGTYVKDAMKARKFDNTSEYFRHLVREDFARHAGDANLRQLIDAGLASGESAATVEEIWQDAIAEADG